MPAADSLPELQKSQRAFPSASRPVAGLGIVPKARVTINCRRGKIGRAAGRLQNLQCSTRVSPGSQALAWFFVRAPPSCPNQRVDLCISQSFAVLRSIRYTVDKSVLSGDGLRRPA
jgi:hypothetical protein